MAGLLPSPVFTLRSTKGEITSLTFIKLGDCKEQLLTGHSSGELQLWELETNRPTCTWLAHTKRIRWLGHSSGRLFSYGADASLIFWDTKSLPIKQISLFPLNSYTHCPCDVTTKEPVLIAAPHDNSDVNFISADKQVKVKSLKLQSNQSKYGVLMFLKLFEIGDKTYLWTSYENGAIILWNVDESVQLSEHKSHQEPVTCIDFHVPSMYGISGFVDDKLTFWNLKQDFKINLNKLISITNPGLACVKIHPKGLYAATGGCDGRVRIFSWKTFKPLAVLDFHSETINGLAFSKESLLLAAGSKDGRVSFWNLYNTK